MHIISSLFIIISFDSIDYDVPVHYYIFVIDSMYCFIRIYVTVINMYMYEINKYICLPVWRSTTDSVVMRLSPVTDIYVVHCWSIAQITLIYFRGY